MKLLDKLHKIEKEKYIYDIHYCRAGIGFIFYYEDEDDGTHWNTGLSVEKYYPTFEEAVEGEYNKLNHKKGVK